MRESTHRQTRVCLYSALATSLLIRAVFICFVAVLSFPLHYISVDPFPSSLPSRSSLNHACATLTATRPSQCRYRNAVPDSLSAASLGGLDGGEYLISALSPYPPFSCSVCTYPVSRSFLYMSLPFLRLLFSSPRSKTSARQIL